MSDAAAWAIVAVMMVPQIVMVGLNRAPKEFWRNLAKRSPTAAHSLWGFSHLFGPLSRPGEAPAWEKLP